MINNSQGVLRTGFTGENFVNTLRFWSIATCVSKSVASCKNPLKERDHETPKMARFARFLWSLSIQ